MDDRCQPISPGKLWAGLPLERCRLSVNAGLEGVDRLEGLLLGLL